jgi:hypothetical protein
VRLKRISLIALCVWLVFAQGCKRQQEPSLDLTLAHEVSPQPPRVGPATIVLRLTDAAGTAVSGARLELEGNMSHPGMAPVFAEATEIEPGRYRVNLELSMAGDWHLAVRITLRDGRKFERQFEIKGVSSG